MKNIKAPLDEKTITSLKAGDEVLISGVVLTARDQAHLRLVKLIEGEKELPTAMAIAWQRALAEKDKAAALAPDLEPGQESDRQQSERDEILQRTLRQHKEREN